MRVVRLPSGLLACVHQVFNPEASVPDGAVFQAHSGSLEAEGPTEEAALAALEERVRASSSTSSSSGTFDILPAVPRRIAGSR